MARRRIQTRLIVSFIGNTDIKYVRPVGQDISPILRILMQLSAMSPRVPPANTRLLLFDEDAVEQTVRRDFCEALRQTLPELGLDGLELERHQIALPEGPTDLNALYEQAWAAIPTYGPQVADEIVFNISSGTPAMKFTLLLAAECLPLQRARLLEASSEQGVQEVQPPYVLAARERRLSESRGQPRLSEKAYATLLADTVVDDPQVAAAYAALYKAASNRKAPSHVIVRGPTGSGKWHACRQFAAWRRGEEVHWLLAEQPTDIPEDATLLIRHLDLWPPEALNRLTQLASQRPDLAIAASMRTDRPPTAPPLALASDGLRGAAHIELPALGARDDVAAVGEVLARNLGIHAGKLKARLQHDFLTDVYPRNLHDLASLLATAGATSAGAHPERKAYVQAKEINNARALLEEACRLLAGLEFGRGRPGLEEVLDVIRSSVVASLYAGGRNQHEIGELLGMGQSKVSQILKKRVDLWGWRSEGHIGSEDH